MSQRNGHKKSQCFKKVFEFVSGHIQRQPAGRGLDLLVVGCQGPSRWRWCSRPTPGPPPSPFFGFRSYPLRGSHSLDDLLDRPGTSTASSEYWDGQSRSRTPSRVPSRAPSPSPTPLPGSRRSSMGSMGVASDVKVSPSSPVCPQPWGHPVGRETRDQVALSALPRSLAAGPPIPASVYPSGAEGGGSMCLRDWSPHVLLRALEKACPPHLPRGDQTKVLRHQSLRWGRWGLHRGHLSVGPRRLVRGQCLALEMILRPRGFPSLKPTEFWASECSGCISQKPSAAGASGPSPWPF